jgi:hypothetical protein
MVRGCVTEQTPVHQSFTKVFTSSDSFRWRVNQEKPMPKSTAFAPSWNTSSFGHPADTSPMECSALADHLSVCSRSRGPWPALRTGAAVVRGFVVPRLVTTVFFVAIIAGTTWFVS